MPADEAKDDEGGQQGPDAGPTLARVQGEGDEPRQQPGGVGIPN